MIKINFTYWQGMLLLLMGIIMGIGIGYKWYRNALVDKLTYFMRFEDNHRELKFNETIDHFMYLTWIDRLRLTGKIKGDDK